MIDLCYKKILLLTLVLQGEFLGRLPRSLPHALQLGHRGDNFQQSLNWKWHFLSCCMSLINEHHLMVRSTATWVWTATDAGWATTA